MNKNYNLRKVGEPLNSKSLDWPTVCEEIKKILGHDIFESWIKNLL